MENAQRKELKAKAQSLSAFTSIGKNGITDNTIIQIDRYLSANKLCKVKLLRTYIDESGRSKKDLAQELADRTRSELVDLIGLTVILWRR